MNGIEPLVKSILGKDDIAACGLSELQSLARQYPYFAPLHLMLAEKIKTLDKDLYEQQLEKVSLYIHQPLWLHYLLNQGNFEIDIQEKETETNPEHSPGITPLTEELNQKDDLAFKESNENILPNDEVEQQAIITALQNEPAADEQIKNPETEKKVEKDETSLITKEHEETQADSTNEENETQELANAVQNEPAEFEKIDSVSDKKTEEESVGNFNPPPAEDQKEQDHFQITVSDEDEDSEEINEDESDLPPLHIPSLKIEPLSDTGKDLLFEPYHTVDYFASQGIKNPVENIPKDRFTHQLKSFTEWLKTMKKLPDDVMENQLDAGSEEKVQTLASHSIAENEILTETMAEVWLKQGDRQKAVEVYHKLSLQNPSKSHYFAAKIESLNKQ